MVSKIVRIIKTMWYKLICGRRIKFDGFPNFVGYQPQFNILAGKIHIGKSCIFKKSAYFAVVDDGVLNIGNSVSFNRNCMVICHDAISIGDGCAFGPNTVVYDHDHDHIFGPLGLESGFKTAPVTIGANCWIGANVTILRGTHIGEGCVIGAGAVVKGNVPAHSLVTADRSLIIKPIEKRHSSGCACSGGNIMQGNSMPLEKADEEEKDETQVCT